MNRKLLIVWCISWTLVPLFSYSTTQHNRLKLDILSSFGGGGHMSAAHAIKRALDPYYDVEIINLIQDILMSLDPVRKLTFNRYTGEDLYNYGLKNGWISLLNMFVVPIGNQAAYLQQNTIKRLISDYFKRSKRKPDMLISVIPCFNGALLDYVQHKRKNKDEKEIPVMVVTADLDGINYINGIKRPTYDLFYYCIPYEDKEIRKRIKSAHIRNSQIKVTGFPTRPDFFEKKEVNQLKQFYKVPLQKPIVMLMMGAAGSQLTYTYLTALLNTNISMHIIACLGRNTELRAKIEGLHVPPTISLTALGFTDRISDIMAISDLLITKPGPTTMAEALAMNLPMILDSTGKSLFWEKMNLKFIEKNRFGHVLTSFSDLERILNKYLVRGKTCQSIKRRMMRFDKGCFESRIRYLVRELLKKAGCFYAAQAA